MTTLAENKLAEITRDIHFHEEQARQGAGMALQHKATIGAKLIEARDNFISEAKREKRGSHEGSRDWARWAHDEFGWSRMHLSRHIRLRRFVTRGLQISGDMTLRGVLGLLKGPTLGDKQPATGLVLTGHVPAELWNGEGEPPLAELVAACTDWRVRRG